ncbi:MAG TPA: ABC transporter permease [Candidatus Baltobacteraceae bacterium]|nr:ABC transporter permease [Candidatus Baltobacteraceae bacterium]
MSEIITVYSAEVMRRLRSRTFFLGLVFGIIGVVVIIELPQWFDSYSRQTDRILLAGNPQLVAAARPLLAKDFVVAGNWDGSGAPSLEMLKARRAAAVVAIARGASGVRVTLYAKDPGMISASQLRRDLVPLNLQFDAGIRPQRIGALLNIPVRTQSLVAKFGTAAESDAARAVAYILLVLLYILIMVNSQLIMSSVAEEKTSRIAELLVASVNPGALLAGKVGASATLALGQMAIWVAVAWALSASGQGQVAAPSGSEGSGFSFTGISSSDVAGFVVFFLVGFLQTSTLFAAIASLINRTEDLGSIAGPMFVPVVAGFIIAISALAVPDSPAVIVTSFIPLIAPFVMFARIVVSSVPAWQIAASLAINIAAICAIAVLGGKIYRVGMLLYGRTPRLSQIWHAINA